MSKVIYVIERFKTPLASIEYVLSFLIFTAVLITGYNSLSGDPDPEMQSGLVAIVGDYRIIPITFAVMAVFALSDMLAMTFAKTAKGLKIRSWATFVFAIGFFFEFILAFLVIGPNSLVWANNLAVAVISSILYLSIKVMQQDERE
jgi:hypothetical protein